MSINYKIEKYAVAHLNLSTASFKCIRMLPQFFQVTILGIKICIGY